MQIEARRLLASVQAREDALDAHDILNGVEVSIQQNSIRSLNRSQANSLRKALAGKCALAESLCAQSIAMDADNPAAWRESVRAYELSANPVEANAVLTQALSRFPSDPVLQVDGQRLRAETAPVEMETKR